MDDFSWGNTRYESFQAIHHMGTRANAYASYSKVVGEGNQKTVVIEDDEPFNEGMIPYRTFKGTPCYCCDLDVLI